MVILVTAPSGGDSPEPFGGVLPVVPSIEPDAGSAEDLRLALQAAGVGVWDVDTGTGKRRWSPEMRAILGLDALTPADPALFTRLIHPEDRDWVTAEYFALYRPGGRDTYDIECRVNRADDGALRWVAMKGRVLRDTDGASVRGVGTLTDITDRKLAERTSSFQAVLLDRMTEGVSLSTEDGTIVFTNPAEDALFGYESGELIGKHVSVQNAYPPEENDEIVAGVIASLKAGGVWEGEWRNVRKDGSEFYTSSRITTVTIDDRLHFLCVQRDVSAEREARERERLLSAEVDHRARNALAVVQSLVRLTPFSSRESFIETLTGRIDAMARVHTLLSRNAWRGATVREVICAELAAFEAGGKIAIEGPDVGLRLETAQALGLLIHELTTNAGKYGALSTETGRLAVGWRLGQSGELELDWKESGGPPVTPPERTGFGSKLIKGAASQLGGALHRSWEPDGLRCELSIGQGRLQAAEPRGPRTKKPRGGGGSLDGARILVVEDETLLALELASELERAGASVVGPAHTLEQGLVLGAEQALDAAVLDVNLVGRSVAPLAAMLREKGVPVVLVSGYQAPDIPAAAVLQKPVDHAALAAALREQLAPEPTSDAYPA